LNTQLIFFRWHGGRDIGKMSLCPETELLQGEDEFEDIDWDDTQVEEATGNFSLSLSLLQRTLTSSSTALDSCFLFTYLFLFIYINPIR
jgi:hypothetical protein